MREFTNDEQKIIVHAMKMYYEAVSDIYVTLKDGWELQINEENTVNINNDVPNERRNKKTR